MSTQPAQVNTGACLSIGTWNINGITESNKTLRYEIINNLDCDIFGINETHLINYNKLLMQGFPWFGFNRQNIHVNARRGSGGVGFLVKETLHDTYSISLIDKSVEGVIGIQLSDKITNFCIVVICCYLPPERSSRGRTSDTVFAHLISLLYLYEEQSDILLVCGDFNGRIGSGDDCINGVDKLPQRKVIDNVRNAQGDEFINR